MRERTRPPGLTHDDATDASVRVRLEGGYELLEQARLRFQSMNRQLSGVKRQERVPLTRVELEEVRAAEPAVESALERLSKVNGLLGLGPKTESRTLEQALHEERRLLATRLCALRLKPPPPEGATLGELLEHAVHFAAAEPLVRLEGALPASGREGRNRALAVASMLLSVGVYFAIRGALKRLGLDDWLSWIAIALSGGGATLLRRLRRVPHRHAWLGFNRSAGEVILWTGVTEPSRARIMRRDSQWKTVALRKSEEAQLTVSFRSDEGSEELFSLPWSALGEARQHVRRLAREFSLFIEDEVREGVPLRPDPE